MLDEILLWSFNIRFGTANDGSNSWKNRDALVCDILKMNNPVILGIQEGMHFQLAEIMRRLPGYSMIGVGRDDGHQGGEYSPILYQPGIFDVCESSTFWFSSTPNIPGSKTYGNRLPRICSWGLFKHKMTGLMFYFYNLHIDHESSTSRMKSLEQLIQTIKTRTHQHVPVIVSGDFNSIETSSEIKLMASEFMDTYRVIHPMYENFGPDGIERRVDGTFHSFLGNWDGEHIDYIFTKQVLSPVDQPTGIPRPALQLSASGIVHDSLRGKYPSDHFPIFTRFRVLMK